MTGNSIAIDTNLAIAVLNGEPAALSLLSACSDICLPVPVLAELHFGALNSSKAHENQKTVRELASRLRILNAASGTAEVHAGLRLQMKRAGTPIPQNDLWIAAICVESGLALGTKDAHFDVVPGLSVTKW